MQYAVRFSDIHVDDSVSIFHRKERKKKKVFRLPVSRLERTEKICTFSNLARLVAHGTHTHTQQIIM